MCLIQANIKIVLIAGCIIINKKYCKENPCWDDGLTIQGIRNVCESCCEDYKKECMEKR